MGQLAYIQFLQGQGGQVDPGYGVAAPPPGAVQLPVFPFDPTRPDNSLPGSQPGVDNTLPGGPPTRPDNTLPGSQPGVDNTLPGGGNYPSFQPIVPGARFIVKWVACIGLALVPDNSLPSAPARPDQGLPPTAQPKK